MKKRKIFLPHLQSIRGIASVVVLLGHAFSVYADNGFSIYFNYLLNTHAAVVLFFILSGYVLSSSFSSKYHQKNAVKIFYITRIFRIYPIIFVASSISLLLIYLNDNARLFDGSLWFNARFREDRYNITYILLSYIGISAFLLPPAWSIAVELGWSFIFPLIYKYIKYNNTLIFSMLLLVIYIAMNISPGPYDIIWHILPFFVGVFIFEKQDKILKILPSGMSFCILPISLLIIIGTNIAYRCDAMSYNIYSLFQVISSTAIMIKFVFFHTADSILNSKILVYVGDISYGLYAIHFPVMYFLIYYFVDPLKSAIKLSCFQSNFVCAIFTLVISLLVSVVFYKIIERPAIDFGKRVNDFLIVIKN